MKRCKSELEARDETKAEDAQAMPGVQAPIVQILDECEELWGNLIAKHGHPLKGLREELSSFQYRKQFCMILLRKMLEAHPSMRETCIQEIDEVSARDVSIGASGEAHLLMIGYEKMKGTHWPAMWKKEPSNTRLRDVWRRALTSGRDLDTTSRSLKICVHSDLCKLNGKQLSNEVLFAGYASGSTLGGGSLCLAWMLMTVDQRNPEYKLWDLPEVNTFMRSIARIKTVFVIYSSPMERAADAWRTP